MGLVRLQPDLYFKVNYKKYYPQSVATIAIRVGTYGINRRHVEISWTKNRETLMK